MKKILGWVLVAVLAVAIPLAYGTVVKDDMDYEGTNTHTGTMTRTGAYTQTGDYTLTGDLDLNTGRFTQQTVTSSYTAGTGFSITGTDEGSIFLINSGLMTETVVIGPGHLGPTDNAGVTVSLAAPTAATDGMILHIIKSDSGATDIFLHVVGSLPIKTTSGTTDVLAIDAQGDIVTVLADHLSAVSYWVLNHIIQ